MDLSPNKSFHLIIVDLDPSHWDHRLKTEDGGFLSRSRTNCRMRGLRRHGSFFTPTPQMSPLRLHEGDWIPLPRYAKDFAIVVIIANITLTIFSRCRPLHLPLATRTFQLLFQGRMCRLKFWDEIPVLLLRGLLATGLVVSANLVPHFESFHDAYAIDLPGTKTHKAKRRSTQRQNNATNPSWKKNGTPTTRIPKPDKGHQVKNSNQCAMEDRDLELEAMPVNRQMLYRGILQNKHLRGHFVPRHS